MVRGGAWSPEGQAAGNEDYFSFVNSALYTCLLNRKANEISLFRGKKTTARGQ